MNLTILEDHHIIVIIVLKLTQIELIILRANHKCLIKNQISNIGQNMILINSDNFS